MPLMVEILNRHDRGKCIPSKHNSSKQNIIVQAQAVMYFIVLHSFQIFSHYLIQQIDRDHS